MLQTACFPGCLPQPKGCCSRGGHGNQQLSGLQLPPAGKELLSIRHFQAFFLSFSPGQLQAKCPHPHTTHRDTGFYFLAQKCCGTFRDEPRSPAQCKRAGSFQRQPGPSPFPAERRPLVPPRLPQRLCELPSPGLARDQGSLVNLEVPRDCSAASSANKLACPCLIAPR